MADRSRRVWQLLIRHPLWTVFLVALIVRVAVAVFLTRYVSGSLVFDDSTYSYLATTKAAGRDASWAPYIRSLYDATSTFTIPLTFLYRVFGPVRLVGQIMVALAGAGAATLLCRLAIEVCRPTLAFLTGALVALMPSGVLWSSVLLKDPFVWIVLIALAVAVALAGRDDRSVSLGFAGVAAASLLILLGNLRVQSLVVAVWAMVLGAVAGSPKNRMIRVTGALAIAIAIPWAMNVGPLGFDMIFHPGSLEERRLANAANAQSAFANSDLAPDSSAVPSPTPPPVLGRDVLKPAQLAALAATLGKTPEQVRRLPAAEIQRLGNAAPDLDEKTEQKVAREIGVPAAQVEEIRRKALTTIGRAGLTPSPTPGVAQSLPHTSETTEFRASIESLPRGLSVMLFEPFPWQRNPSKAFEFAQWETLIWYPMLGLAFLGLFSAKGHLRVLAFPILYGLGIVFAYALTEGNIGTAYRHRGEVVWVVALLAGFGASALVDRAKLGAQSNYDGLVQETQSG